MTLAGSCISRIALLSGASMVLFAAAGLPVESQDTIQKTLRWPARGVHKVEVSGINGSVHVVGYDGSDVEVIAHRTVRAVDEAAAEEARRLVQPSFTEGADAISVCADASHCGCHTSDNGRTRREGGDDRFRVDVDFQVRVPRDAVLTACTVNHGEMTVDNVSGLFDVSNVNGPVTLSRMGGSGSAASVNGAVTAAFTRKPTEALAFKTVNGDIEVRLPADLSADLHLKTLNGSLYTDFDVTMPANNAGASVERRDRRTVYRQNQFASVRVGSGGPVLTFEGLNGDIRVLRAQPAM